MAAVASRTRADAVRNRERVVAAAAAVFAEKGEDAVVPEIAARAAVATERARWFEHETRAAAADPDPWGAFTEFMARFADAHCADRGMVFSMSQGIDRPELLEARAAAQEAVGELMARAKAQGAMRADAEPAD